MQPDGLCRLLSQLGSCFLGPAPVLPSHSFACVEHRSANKPGRRRDDKQRSSGKTKSRPANQQNPFLEHPACLSRYLECRSYFGSPFLEVRVSRTNGNLRKDDTLS